MGKKRKDSDSARKRREDRLEKSKERADKYFDSGVIRAGFLLMQDANESVLISASVASITLWKSQRASIGIQA